MMSYLDIMEGDETMGEEMAEGSEVMVESEGSVEVAGEGQDE